MKLYLQRLLKLTGKKKASRTYEALGYTEKDFVAHIESQFLRGMTWTERESFHVDHIIPISWFFKNGITDPSIINALSNLRPVFPLENRQKSDTLPDDFEERVAQILKEVNS